MTPTHLDLAFRHGRHRADGRRNFQVVATREAEQRPELAAHADVVAAAQVGDVVVVGRGTVFLELGASLWR